MIATPTRRATVEDYRKLPGDDWRYQLIDGEIVRNAERAATSYSLGETFWSATFPHLDVSVDGIFAR